MSDESQTTNGTSALLKKWWPVAVALGLVGGGGTLGGLKLGSSGIDETRKVVAEAKAHCDTERGKVVAEMSEARRAFADLTKTLQLTIGKMEGLEKAQDVVAKRFDEHLRDFFRVISGRTK